MGNMFRAIVMGVAIGSNVGSVSAQSPGLPVPPTPLADDFSLGGPATSLPAAPMPAAPGPAVQVSPTPLALPPEASVPTAPLPNPAWQTYASPAVTPGYTTTGAGPAAGVGPFWAPGGYEPRIGSPYYYHDPAGGEFVNTGNPYYDHFGPGFHRSDLHGHYRFPYYNYRAPWYYPGRAVYNRDTNRPW